MDHLIQAAGAGRPVVVVPATEAEAAGAAELAGRLGLAHRQSADFPEPGCLLLVVTADRIELRMTGPKAPGAVQVDFTAGAINYRRLHGGGRGQALARAFGIRGVNTPSVVDATAGLGRDAFVLATLGCTVRMFERSPVIAALLADGLRRARNHPDVGPIIRHRMTLVQGDSRDFLRDTAQQQPDVVYLDPMYPPRSKRALVKKEMRILRSLVGDDQDAPELLAAGLALARKRVVVKRHRTAPPIAGPEPSLVIRGRTSRFDIYLLPPS